MPPPTGAVEAYLDAHRDLFEDELCELLRIRSVSADATCRDQMDEAAAWLAERFRGLGLASEIVPTVGHPLVVAESPPVPGAPTALVYGHYDVQPVDPLDQWVSPPFEPTRRHGNVYARGANDDKGQMLTHLFSARAWLEAEGRLPIRLIFLIEGEEEVGSAGVEQFIVENTDRLACDCVVISDSAQFAPGQPAITYGLRGINYYELRLTGPDRDLHSGSFGGSVTNPANVLARLLAALVGDDGRVRVPGFYDDVVPLSDAERKQLAELPFDEAEYFGQFGLSAGVGESAYTTLERRWARPTCDVNGLTAGYQGEGAKTVLPAAASAKFSFRLVPNQDPKKIARSLRNMLADLCPAGIQMELVEHAGSAGVLVPTDSPYVQAAVRAIEHAFGRPPLFTREGGSIPIVGTFHQALKVDTLLLGWGQDDDNTHSPNEKFSLADFHRGIRASARLWHELSRIQKD